MKYLALLFGSLLLFVPLFLIGLRKLHGKKAKHALYGNIASFFGLLILTAVFGFTSSAMAAPDATATATTTSLAASNSLSDGLRYLSAALAVGISGIAGGLAVASSASAAMGAISENENVFGKSLIFVGLAEGVALYGLIVAMLLIFVS